MLVIAKIAIKLAGRIYQPGEQLRIDSEEDLARLAVEPVAEESSARSTEVPADVSPSAPKSRRRGGRGR